MIDLRIPDDLSIPDFLRISKEDRQKAWENRGRPLEARPVTAPVTNPAQRGVAFADVRKEKNKRAFERMMARHPGEKYNRKLKKWVPL